MQKKDLESIQKRLLNIVQADFPLCLRPWLEISRQLGITEEETIAHVADLKRKNIIREISAIFDTRRLGYSSTLVAMRFYPETLDRSARLINLHPGVSHNYSRESYFNLWFTLAVPPTRSLESETVKLGEIAGAKKFRIMPTLRFFKIGVNFDMERKVSNAKAHRPSATTSKDVNISFKDKKAIIELQEDLPLVPEPFEEMSHRVNMPSRDLLKHAEELKNRGLMRRYGAVLHHRRAGFSANAMVVWNVPEFRAEEVGEVMAASPSVTHCYERPRYPDWRFSHFTMLHATTREECERIAVGLENAIKIRDRLSLYSTTEYKKQRIRYFVEDDFDLNDIVDLQDLK